MSQVKQSIAQNSSKFPAYYSRNPTFPAKYPRGRPPEPPVYRRSSVRPNFVIKLTPHRESAANYRNSTVVRELVSKHCKSMPYDVVFRSQPYAILLFFTQWSYALEGVVKFWQTLLSGEHHLTPMLIRNVVVSSDGDELNERLRPLFAAKLRGLETSEVIKKWEDKMRDLGKQLDGVTTAMRKPQQLRLFQELKKKKEGFRSEIEVISNRIDEFKAGVRCLLNHVEGVEEEDGAVSPFRFKNGVDWGRVYHLIMRECRRLDDGLPIYAYRRELLHHISSQQIMVLIGETGSGKSTQLVQFLADSGLVADGSLICTQLRKIAVTSLEHRVQEESCGCYEAGMNDRMLQGFSCILVDEAHERTLNTDLLLAMLKKLLPLRPDLRLIIMSATVDAQQLSEYFYGCGVFSVAGRNFPVEVAKRILGETTGKGVPPSKDTSWWNEEVRQGIRKKRECYQRLGKCRSDENYEKYKEAKREAKKAVRDARAKVNQDLYAKLDTKEGEKDIYRIARMRERKTCTIGTVKCVKDTNQRVLVEDKEIKDRWLSYFDKLFNEG